jgi:small-conductance mechanosensitive channel
VQLYAQLLRELQRAENWLPWMERLIRVAVILAVAWIVTRIACRLIGRLRILAARMLEKHGGASDTDFEKRAATLITVLVKLVSVAIWLVALVMSLSELTFNIQPLLAGIGVAGLALGLGAQTLIKDWLGGLFILIEDQVRIGDAVSIGNVSGSVEEVNLRTTVLRAESGAVHIIPNGSITQITNLTREYSYYLFETTLAYSADAKRALEVLAQAGESLVEDERFKPALLSKLEVMGVDRFTDRGMLIRARIKTLPSQQALVGRELNLRVKIALDTAGIPFP